MKLFKSFCLSACIYSAILSADQVEIIQVNEGPNNVNQGYDLVLVVQQLKAEVRALRGMAESQRFELDGLREQQQEMYTDLDSRLGGTRLVTEFANSTVEPLTKTLPADEQQDYSAAFAFIKSQELDKAEVAFRKYVQQHPKAKRVSNAFYWLGEVNLAQGKLPEAGGYFEKLISQYPQSAKIPDAMFKLGKVYQKMNNDNNAVLIWQDLISSYPRAAAAKLAESALQ